MSLLEYALLCYLAADLVLIATIVGLEIHRCRSRRR